MVLTFFIGFTFGFVAVWEGAAHDWNTITPMLNSIVNCHAVF